VTGPYDDPDWTPWDVESARRWSLPPDPGVPASANWCTACDRLEHRGDPLHSTRTAAPADPPLTCRSRTVHRVTVTPPDAPPFDALWCEACRHLVPSGPHPDAVSRAARTAGCVRSAVLQVRTA
jgi:hypothetical protein